MAKARKCDRCGQYYEKNTNKLLTGTYFTVSVYPLSRIDVWSSYDEQHHESYDLCDKCAEKFMKFISTEETNET